MAIREMNSKESNRDELPSFRLDGRLAVITGASDGIGRAFALAYARSGAEVVLVSRTREKLLEVKRTIEAAGGRTHVITADVAKIDEIRSIEKYARAAIALNTRGTTARANEMGATARAAVLVGGDGDARTAPCRPSSWWGWRSVCGWAVANVIQTSVPPSGTSFSWTSRARA